MNKLKWVLPLLMIPVVTFTGCSGCAKNDNTPVKTTHEVKTPEEEKQDRKELTEKLNESKETVSEADLKKSKQENPGISKAVLKALSVKTPESEALANATEVPAPPKASQDLQNLRDKVLAWDKFETASYAECEDYLLNDLKASEQNTVDIMYNLDGWVNWKRHAKARYQATNKNKEEIATFSEIEQKFATGEYKGGIVD